MYEHLALYQAETLRKKVLANEITYEGILDDRILARVCQGVLESLHTPPKYRQYYLNQISQQIEMPIGKAAD